MRQIALTTFMLLIMSTTVSAHLNETQSQATLFTINIPETIKSEWQKTAAKTLLDDIYSQVGITPEYVFYPTKRALKLLNEGIIDAEAGRLAMLEKQFVDVYRIPTKLIDLQVGLFCLKPESCTLNNELRFALKQGFLLGYKVCQNHLLNCIEWTTASMVAKMLESELVDAVLVPLHESYQVICDTPYKQWFFTELSEYRNAVYHYIHKKHSHLADSLNAAIVKSISKGLADETQNRWQDEIKSCNKTIVSL